MKFCKNCKYFDARHSPLNLSPYCTKHTYAKQDPISGESIQLGIRYAQYEREPGDPKPLRYLQALVSLDKKYLKQNCGPEAIYYETK